MLYRHVLLLRGVPVNKGRGKERGMTPQTGRTAAARQHNRIEATAEEHTLYRKVQGEYLFEAIYTEMI